MNLTFKFVYLLVKSNIMEKSLSLEAFKELVVSNKEFKNELISKRDIVDVDNGTMTIHSENLNKYLEKYACKNAEDLIDTLWYSYGLFVKVV